MARFFSVPTYVSIVKIALFLFVVLGFFPLAQARVRPRPAETLPASKLSAGACPPPSSLNLTCRSDEVWYRTRQELIENINGFAEKALIDASQLCLYSEVSQPRYKDIDTVPATAIIQIPGGTCKITSKKAVPPQTLVSMTVQLTAQPTTYATSLKDETQSVKSTEQVETVGTYTANFQADFDQKSAKPNRIQLNPGSIAYTFKGPVTFKVDIKKDFHAPQTWGQGLKLSRISPTRSSISSDGTVNMNIAIMQLPGEGPKLTQFEFCPATCKITTTQTAEFALEKTDTGDLIDGSVDFKASHKEEYSGTAQRSKTNPDNFEWSPNLVVKKEDIRNWQHLVEGAQYSHYKEGIVSTAELRPYQGNVAVINTKISKKGETDPWPARATQLGLDFQNQVRKWALTINSR